MKEKIEQRFTELIQEGNTLLSRTGNEYYVPEYSIALFQTWLSSAINLIQMISPKQSYHYSEANKIMDHKDIVHGLPQLVFKRMLGLLTSANEEWKRGILTEIEYIVAAETFDDFLDHAAQYHKGNKKIESAILASTVLEDTIKKIAIKNGIETRGITLEPLVENLVTQGVINTVKGKRVKAYAGTRNKALHAEWDEFDIRDIGEMIKGIRELIEDFL